MKFNTEGPKKKRFPIPHVGYRVVGYSIIILLILFYRWMPKEPKPDGQNKTPAPGTNPQQPTKTEPGIDPVSLIESIIPKVALKQWSVVKEADGSQKVIVLLDFLSSRENVTLPELSLRGLDKEEEWAKGEAEAKAGEGKGEPEPTSGPQTILFRIPPGKGDFSAGRILLWNRELVKLDETSQKKGEDLPPSTP